MKRILCILFACVVMLVACADDDSDFAMQPKVDSSSSKITKSSSSLSSIRSSSSRGKSSSSSSVKRSSSSVKSSSSSTRKSSSSSKVSSSSSKTSSSSVVDPSTVVKGSMTDSRDGQTYKTVTIGSQTWMAENLNFVTEKSKCYRDADSNCTKFGRRYTWYDAVNCDVAYDWGRECESSSPVRGVCPEAWHLPSSKEWQTLRNAVGDYNSAGKMLKATSGWLYDGNGTDAYSFSVIPAWSSEDVEYHGGEEGGEMVYFWSSTTDHESESDHREYSAYTAFLYFDFDMLLIDPTIKTHYSSIRCLKD